MRQGQVRVVAGKDCSFDRCVTASSAALHKPVLTEHVANTTIWSLPNMISWPATLGCLMLERARSHHGKIATGTRRLVPSGGTDVERADWSIGMS